MNRPRKVTSVDLHIFCDASKKAFTAVGYCRFTLSNDTFHTSIIMAKSRIAPLNSELSIPRLELETAILPVCLAKILEEEKVFEISNKFFWSD